MLDINKVGVCKIKDKVGVCLLYVGLVCHYQKPKFPTAPQQDWLQPLTLHSLVESTKTVHNDS